MSDEARIIIARAMGDLEQQRGERFYMDFPKADAIIAALDAAGWSITRKSYILEDAFGKPNSIDEVAPNVFEYTWPA